MACLSGRAKTKESAKSALEQLIAEEDKSIRAPSTHEVVEGIIDNLNQVCTRKVMEELSKTEAAQPVCSVDITKANSSLPMAKIAATMGYKSGFDRLVNSAHEQVTFREGRWKGELRLRNEISQGARSQTGEEEDEHRQQLSGVAQGVGEVPDKWQTPTRHGAEEENHGHATRTTTSSAKPFARP